MDINDKLKYNVDWFKERYNQYDDIEDPFEKAIKRKHWVISHSEQQKNKKILTSKELRDYINKSVLIRIIRSSTDSKIMG